MIRKYLSLVLIGLMLCGVNLHNVSARTRTDNALEKIKTDVYRLGIGKKSTVIVKLKDGTKIQGYISQTLEDSFDVIDAKTNQPTTVLYTNVVQIKKQGSSKGVKTLLGVAIVAGIVVLIVTLPGKRPLGTICPLGCRSF